MQTEAQKKEIEALEEQVRVEKEKLLALRQLVARDKQLRTSIMEKTSKNEREAKFYQQELKRISKDGEIMDKMREFDVDQLQWKRERVKDLEKALKEFEGIEPTNEALQKRIEELQKSRLSLDMSFEDII